MSSRVGRKPIEVPAGVQIQIDGSTVLIKGQKGQLTQPLPRQVSVSLADNQIKVTPKNKSTSADAIAGTIRAILNNHVEGVSKGFSKKLQLVGVGYRAQIGKSSNGETALNLTLGLSHPVAYIAPKEVQLTSAAATEIEVAGVDKQLVGQVAANIRGICGGIRKPEPYKGKGIRYADEKIILKETKKK